jgi:hypothetical protein
MTDQPHQPRGAVLQFEISREWWNKLHISQTAAYSSENALQRLYVIAQSAACDVIRNGGTLVIVASSDKITMV